MTKKPIYKENSLADFAHRGLKRISYLAKSQRITDKLIAFNTVLFVLILALNITYWLIPETANNLVVSVYFAVSLVLALIGSLVYGKFLEVIAEFPINKVESLRIASIILFTNLSVALIGFLFKIDFLITASFIIIGIQFLVILLGSLIDFSRKKTENKNVQPLQLRELLGTFGSIITIINFIIWLVSIAAISFV